MTVSLRDTILTLVVPRARSDAAGSVVTADLYSGNFLGRRLVGQVPNLRLDANNMLYVEARDVAGEYSAPLRMPAATEIWYVKKPRARLLLVNDYTNFDAQLAQTTYAAALGFRFRRRVHAGGSAGYRARVVRRRIRRRESSAGWFRSSWIRP